MMYFNKLATLSNDEGPVAGVLIRFADKGKGRRINWVGSFQLIGMSLEEGGVYEVIFDDGVSIPVTITQCDMLPPDKCLVACQVHGDVSQYAPPEKEFDKPEHPIKGPPPVTRRR